MSSLAYCGTHGDTDLCLDQDQGVVATLLLAVKVVQERQRGQRSVRAYLVCGSVEGLEVKIREEEDEGVSIIVHLTWGHALDPQLLNGRPVVHSL